MKSFSGKIFGILILLAGSAAAQSTGAARIYTIPDGRKFNVDGLLYSSPAAANWLAGTRHVLETQAVQSDGSPKSIYTFQGWQYTGGLLSTNRSVTVTADPALKEFWAVFSVEHALSLNFFDCSGATDCVSPGKVYVNETPYTADADIYMGSGLAVRLIAEAAPGYVFAGWEPGPNQVISGPINNVTMNAPVIARPRFLLARHIRLTTEPAELEVLADRARIATPAMVDWAYGSVHTLGVPTPQRDNFGRWWIFSRWSDGPGENRSVTVPAGGEILTYTAVFVPGTATDVLTSPPGLTLNIDGRDNWTISSFPWGAGETHHLEAPLQQTDAQGRLWQFSSWSNGGPRVQDYKVPAVENAATTRLTAIYSVVGRLTVTSAVAGLTIQVDGADCATPCDIQKTVGTVVRVTAPATLRLGEQSRADFDGWPGSGSYAPEWSMTLSADPAKSHLTYRTMNRLRAAADPAGGASWSMEPWSPDGFYETASMVTVTAMAQPGYRFRRWAGDASGSAPATSVAMNAPRLVEAMMERIPYIAPAGVANAAGGTAGNGVAPGSVVSIFGASLSPETIAAPASPLPQALGCVTVRAGGRLLPLIFVSPEQINFQMPDDTPAGELRLAVSCAGLPDVETTVVVVRNAPGLFAGAAVHEDGSVVTAEAPARVGELLTLYGTGFGPAAVARPFGFAPLDGAAILDEVTVQAGDVVIPVERAFAVPGRVGVDAVQFRAPEMAAGTTQVRVTVNGKTSNSAAVAF